MNDRIAELRDALADYERMWVLVDEAPLFDTLATAARERLEQLESDVLIIRRDDSRLRADLEAIWNRGFAGLAWDPTWLDHVIADLALSQGVDP